MTMTGGYDLRFLSWEPTLIQGKARDLKVEILLLTDHMILSKSFKHADPQFPHLRNGSYFKGTSKIN